MAPVQLRMSPQPIPAGFKFRGKYLHLTYPGHFLSQLFVGLAGMVTSVPLAGWSVACEVSPSQLETDEGDPLDDGYYHTHVCYIWTAPINIDNCRAFDIKVRQDDGSWLDVHPNMQPKLTLRSCELIFTEYHAGRKFSIATGKMEYTPPVQHDYHLPPSFEWNRAIIDEMIAAPSLVEACLVGEIRPKTVNDVKQLRDSAQQTPKPFKHLYPKDSFVDITGGMQWFNLHVHGPTGIGKTKWACAQFTNPLVIKPFNSVGGLEAVRKRYVPGFHDGIVCDEADLLFLGRQLAICFFDPDESTTVNVRFTEFEFFPVRKILLSNEPPQQLYPLDSTGAIDPAIGRRVTFIHATQPTYVARSLRA